MIDFLLPPTPPADGILLVDKPSGITSHDVVYAVRRRYEFKRKGEGKVKVGHAGTLDPLASGLLIVLIGVATKRAKSFEGLDKVYEVTARLGQVRDSYDVDGQVLVDAGQIDEGGDDESKTDERGLDEKCRDEKTYDEKAAMRRLYGVERLHPSLRDLEQLEAETVNQALQRFVGTQDQRVPAYAAVKVGGRKLYELARNGHPMPYAELPVKSITIYEIKDVVFTPTRSLQSPLAPVRDDTNQADRTSVSYPTLSFTAHVSKGTYIRSLVHELGLALGVGACVEKLRRVQVGTLSLPKVD